MLPFPQKHVRHRPLPPLYTMQVVASLSTSYSVQFRDTLLQVGRSLEEECAKMQF